MADAPRSNRPTPRTTAAVEAELRRRIRTELTQARTDANGELDDATLAEIIAKAIAMALGWHLEAPEHTRNATLSSRSWRPAGGPRGAPREFEDRPRRGPPQFPRGPREFDSDYDERRPRGGPPPFRDYDERGPRGGRPPFRGGGFKRGGGGGFGPRRPPRSR